MAATKTAPASKKQIAKPAAPAKPSKPAVPEYAEGRSDKNSQGKTVQAAMTASLLTVPAIAAKVGLSEARVQEHVNYEISKGRSKLDTKKRVVVISQPKYRAG